jgi:hypothetical protein
MSAIVNNDNGPSCMALASLGRLAMDVRSNDLACKERVIVKSRNPTNLMLFDGRDERMDNFIIVIMKNDVICPCASDLTAGEALTKNRAMLEHHQGNS